MSHGKLHDISVRERAVLSERMGRYVVESELFCFTSIRQGAKRAVVEERQALMETLVASPNTLVAISGLAFASAGVVTREAAAGTESTPTMGWVWFNQDHFYNYGISGER